MAKTLPAGAPPAAPSELNGTPYPVTGLN